MRQVTCERFDIKAEAARGAKCLDEHQPVEVPARS